MKISSQRSIITATWMALVLVCAYPASAIKGQQANGRLSHYHHHDEDDRRKLSHQLRATQPENQQDTSENGRDISTRSRRLRSVAPTTQGSKGNFTARSDPSKSKGKTTYEIFIAFEDLIPVLEVTEGLDLNSDILSGLGGNSTVTDSSTLGENVTIPAEIIPLGDLPVTDMDGNDLGSLFLDLVIMRGTGIVSCTAEAVFTSNKNGSVASDSNSCTDLLNILTSVGSMVRTPMNGTDSNSTNLMDGLVAAVTDGVASLMSPNRPANGTDGNPTDPMKSLAAVVTDGDSSLSSPNLTSFLNSSSLWTSTTSSDGKGAKGSKGDCEMALESITPSFNNNWQFGLAITVSTEGNCDLF